MNVLSMIIGGMLAFCIIGLAMILVYEVWGFTNEAGKAPNWHWGAWAGLWLALTVVAKRALLWYLYRPADLSGKL